jgi:hypothetical protein
MFTFEIAARISRAAYPFNPFVPDFLLEIINYYKLIVFQLC